MSSQMKVTTTIQTPTMVVDGVVITFNSNEAEQLSDDDSDTSDDEDNKPLPSTVVFISIYNKQTESNELFRVLLDTGTNRCMTTQQAAERAGLKIKPGRNHNYKTAAGRFTTTKQTRLRAHRILELNSRRILQGLKMQVTDGDLGSYDFIFGRDYMNRYGIDLLFSQKVIQWDGVRMNMRDTEDASKDMKQLNEELTAAIEDPCDPCSVIEEFFESESYAQQILEFMRTITLWCRPTAFKTITAAKAKILLQLLLLAVAVKFVCLVFPRDVFSLESSRPCQR